jgi:Fur family transcriptional regulator, ferric uptake regulator
MSSKTDLMIQEVLQGFEMRCTQGRTALLKILLRAKQALSQEQIAEKLAVREQQLDKATIYRALECFVEVGLVHRAYQQDRVWYYELSHRCSEKQCHPHFNCTACGKTFCLPNAKVPLAKGIKRGFVLQRQKVRLEGLCPKCNEVRKRKKKRGWKSGSRAMSKPRSTRSTRR